MDNFIDYIGFLGAFLTTISTTPQLITIIKNKNVSGVSLKMFITLGGGVFLWLIYGIFKNDYPLIFANIFSLLFILANIFYILKYRNVIPKTQLI